MSVMMVPVRCMACGNTGEIEITKVSSRLRCANCKSHAVDLDGIEATRHEAVIPNVGDKLPDGSTVIEVHAPHTYVVERDGWTSMRQIPWIGPDGLPNEDFPHEAGMFDKMKELGKGIIDPVGDADTSPAAVEQRKDEIHRREEAGSQDKEQSVKNEMADWQKKHDDSAARGLIGGGSLRHQADVSYTRQHYEHMADAISTAPVDAETRVKLANHFADRLGNTNRNFRRDLFVQRASSDPSKRASLGVLSSLAWYAIQRGTGVISGGPYDGEDAARTAAQALNERWETNEYLPVELGTTAVKMADLMDPERGSSYPEGPAPDFPDLVVPFINPSGYRDPAPPKPALPDEIAKRHAKLAEIRAGIMVTNPSMDEAVAHHIAVRTLTEYPEMV